MLDRDAGSFRLAPVDTSVPAGQRYLPGTMVLETTWGTRTGWVIVRDVLLVGPWHHDDERSHTHRRSPTDNDADHVLLRTLRCVNGRVEMHMECEPRVDYGRKAVEWEYAGPGYGKAVGRAEGEALELTLTTDLRIGFEGGRARARTTLRDGDTAFIALSWSDHGGPETYDEAYHRLVYTADYWHEWLSHGEFPDHPWRTYLQRSALTLKGLTYAPTGAMIAAATTSLPETPGGERNWDYRYAWIRDSTFMLWGLYTLGFDEEANDFFYFIRDVASKSDGEMQIMYGIGGEETLTEEMLLHLDGYEHAQPVRVGNGAYAQKQHDVWGALLDSMYLHTKSRDGLAESTWEILKKQVDHAIAAWREPDRGIWEVRGEPQHFTSSKVMCWVACDRGARLARLREDHERSERWQQEADLIHADICENGVDERGAFTQHYDTAALDASCLLIPLVRFLPPDDERVIATVNAIADELTLNGLVQRYKVEETDDGLAGEEGTFAICSFWLVSALAEIGDHDRARALCEKMLGFASGLNLYAEEIDAASGRHLGNFPQAFTHLALINAVMHVIRADHDLAASQPLMESRRPEVTLGE
jgi:GH15 family glucan-1,4-alpha-glucosidase